MLQKNIISEVPPDTRRFYSSAFLVCEASGRWLPIIDLKEFYDRLNALRFLMLTITSVLSTIKVETSYAKYIWRMRTFMCQSIQTAISTSNLPTFISLGTSLRSMHSSPGVHSPWAHCCRLSPSSGDIGITLSR